MLGEGGGGDVPGPGVGLPPVVDGGQLLQHLSGEAVLGRGHRVQLSAVPGQKHSVIISYLSKLLVVSTQLKKIRSMH